MSSASGSSRVVITGLGVITAIGAGKEAFWESLRAGRSGISRVKKFDPSPYPSQMAAQLNGFDFSRYIDPKWSRRMDLTSQLAVSAAKMAVEGKVWRCRERLSGRGVRLAVSE